MPSPEKSHRAVVVARAKAVAVVRVHPFREPSTADELLAPDDPDEPFRERGRQTIDRSHASGSRESGT